MRTKTLLALSLAALCGTVARAQKLTVIPDEDGYMFMGQAISQNGKYICGSDGNYGMFISDWATGTVTRLDASDADEGAELRSVSNDGVGVGYDGPAVTFDFTGKRTALDTKSSIAEAITPDGKYIVGSGDYTAAGGMTPRLWTKAADGYKLGTLPQPRNAFLGYEISGATARHISSDGTTAVGYMVDNMATYPAVAWYLNADDSTYSVYPFSHRFFEAADGTKPYTQFYTSGISANGKWVALQLSDNGTGLNHIARYNVENDSLYVAEIDPDGTITADGTFQTTKIADDGTLLFATGNSLGGYSAGIWKAGEKYPQLLSEVFDKVDELQNYELGGNCVAMDITPDARYIVGFGMNPETYAVETFVLDTSAESSVANAKADNSTSTSGKAARYTIDGRRVSGPVKGINIVVNPQGKARKVVVLK